MTSEPVGSPAHSVENGAQQEKFVGGAWQISRRMADDLGQNVVLGTPVRAVEQDSEGVRAITTQGTCTAERLIMTAPPPLVSRSAFTPQLPVLRQALMGVNGAVVSTDRPLGIVFDQTPPDENLGMLVGLIEGHHAVDMSSLGTQARRKQALADLTFYFGDEATEPLDYVDVDWNVDDWAHGGHAAHMPPGVVTAYGDTLRRPCGRIHWAGTETATASMSYFEGVLQSGVRAASEVLQADR